MHARLFLSSRSEQNGQISIFKIAPDEIWRITNHQEMIVFSFSMPA